MNNYYLSVYFYLSLSVLIPVIVIVKFRKIVFNKYALKLFAYYSILDMCSLVTQNILAWFDKNTIIVSNSFAVIEFCLISLFFIEIFKLKKEKAYQVVVCLLSLIFCIGVLKNGNSNFSNFNTVIISIIFIILSIIYSTKLMREQKIDNLFSYPNFWFNVGILVYFSSSIIIMIFSNYFFSLSLEAQKILWLFHSIINLICYVIFAVGFYKCKPKLKY